VLKGHLANPSVPGTAVQLGTVIASNVIKAIAISPDDSYLVSGGDDCALRLWRVPKKRKWRAQTASAILAGHVGVITCCAISPDGQSIVSGGWDNALLVWHSTTAELRDVLLGHSGRVTCCAISPDGQFIVSGSWDNTLFIWDLATGEERSVLLGHTDHVTCCAISPDSRLVASGGEDQTLRIWDLAGSNLATVFLAGSPTCVEFARTHPLVVSGDSGGSVYLLDLVGAEYGLGPSGSQSGEADLERLLTT
jgi:WD40 repeat protein